MHFGNDITNSYTMLDLKFISHREVQKVYYEN